MATFVATVESQIAPRLVGSAERKRDRSFALLLTGGLTLFAVAVDGYHPYAEDGGLYVAGVKRLLDPALYSHETAFVLEPMRHSLFAPVIAGIVALSHIGLPPALLALHLVSIWATLFAAWMLAARCWSARTARTGAVVLLACWLTLPVAGTALALMDPYLTARSFSTPAMVLALVGALDMSERGGTAHENASLRPRGFLLWAASLLLAAAMHPLMAAYALGATLMLVCARAPRRGARIGGMVALAAAAIVLAACVQAVAKPETADYIRIAMTRTYWFPAQWQWYELAGLAAPLAILMLFAYPRSAGAPHLAPEMWDRAKAVSAQPGAPHLAPEMWDRATAQREPAAALARMAIAVGATAWMVAALFARSGSATHLVARMQPLRAFQIIYLALILLLGSTLGEFVLRRSARCWATAILLLGGIMFGAARAAFPNSNHIELPRIQLPWIAQQNLQRNPWVQAFLWARDDTPKDALFALDADYINAPGEDAQCFRAIAERSALPDYSKDGGEASIAPELTAAWKAGQQAQQSLSAPQTTDAQRLAALSPLGVTWVVLESAAVTRFDCPYANSAVKVCRLRATAAPAP